MNWMDPWKEMEAMEAEMQRMFSALRWAPRDGGAQEEAYGSRKDAKPHFDVCTGDTTVHVLVELPGLSEDDITVTAHTKSVEIETAPGDGPRGMVRIGLDVPVIPSTARETMRNGMVEITIERDLSASRHKEGCEE
jgi:HSP20 family molecular chaperone IbpA